jgi:hypothetical protein
MKKVNFFYIQKSNEAVSELLSKSLPMKTSLQIVRNTDKIEHEMKIAFEMQKTIQKKYADESGQKIDETKIEDFKKEMDEFLKTEVELDLNPIKISDIENIKDLTLSPATIKICQELGLLVD